MNYLFLSKRCCAFLERLASVVKLLAVLAAVMVQARVAVAAEVTAVDVAQSQSATVFSLVLSEGRTAEIFTLGSPYRVIVDIPDINFKLPANAGKGAVGLVGAFRYGLFAERKARVVIDTTGPVKITKAYMERVGKRSVKLNIVLTATDAQSFGDGTGARRSHESSSAGVAPPVEAKPKKAHEKPVIVIDPGHGGIDPGAMGANDMPEKAIVLEVGKKIEQALLATGRYTVEMTRTNDVFVSLDKRVALSEERNADLFLSLHADAIQESLAEKVRGATIYTLSEQATDEQARLMAEKENASDLLAGLEAGEYKASDQVRNILIDLLKRETANFSADLSNLLAQRMGKVIAMSRIPQRSAAFKVLKQSHAPSVLIELGYMSNSEDQKQMATAAWQRQVAAAITTAVDNYFNKRLAEHP